MNKWKRWLELFGVFFKIGLFTFGGGYAMISLIEHEVGQRRRWIDADELMEVFAIAESTPGPIAINCATYIGYKQAGAAGSAAATLGVVLPSFVIIYLISLFIEPFMRLRAVANAFMGIQVAVAFLILRAGVRMAKKLENSAFSWIIFGAAAALMLCVNVFSWRLSTIWLIVGGAAAGLLAGWAARRGRRGERT